MASNFGQMLAAAQAYSTPEQQRALAASQAQGTQFEVEKEKKSQMEELQALMEAEMKKASKSKFGVLGKIGKFASFFNPAVAAAFSTISDVGSAVDQKSQLKKLMKNPKFAKYKNTWLGDPTKQYLKNVKGLASDINPLLTGITSLATSKLTSDIAGKIGGKFKDAFSPELEGISEQLGGGKGGIGVKGPDFLGGDMVGADRFTDSITGESLLDSKGFGIKGNLLDDLNLNLKGLSGAKNFDILNSEKFGKIAKQGIGSGGLKELFGDFDIMEMLEGAGDGTENLAALPALMQLFGVGGGSSDFDASQYFQ